MSGEEKDDATKNETKNEKIKTESVPVVNTMPAIDSAAHRLERLLGGGKSSTSFTSNNKNLVLHSNPSKIVRRWLGTSSGTSGKATLADIVSAGTRLLNPNGLCSEGLSLLSKLKIEDTDMEAEQENEDNSQAKHDTAPNYLSAASCEVESWLLSLVIRLLWRKKDFKTSFAIASQAISIITRHIDSYNTKRSNPSALYPLLARLYRYHALVAESLPNVNIRDEMVHAHSLACLRRDVDSQATLLNLILRDLLSSHQGKVLQFFFIFFNYKNLNFFALGMLIHELDLLQF